MASKASEKRALQKRIDLEICKQAFNNQSFLRWLELTKQERSAEARSQDDIDRLTFFEAFHELRTCANAVLEAIEGSGADKSDDVIKSHVAAVIHSAFEPTS